MRLILIYQRVGTPLKLSEILTEEEQREILHTELFYGYTNGTPELRQRVAEIYGNQFSKENVLITSGSAEANFLSVMTQLILVMK